MEDVGIFYDHLVYFTAVWYIFCGHSVHFMVICYIFPRFGMLRQEKSGNHGIYKSHRIWGGGQPKD
jgi:hypothetical protein